jgi:hypothetical protein
LILTVAATRFKINLLGFQGGFFWLIRLKLDANGGNERKRVAAEVRHPQIDITAGLLKYYGTLVIRAQDVGHLLLINDPKAAALVYITVCFGQGRVGI